MGSAGIAAAQRLGSDRQLKKMLSAQTPLARITTGPDQFELVETEQLAVGTIIEVRAGEVMAKELSRRSARRIELRSFNPEHASYSFDPAELAWMHRIVWASQ